MAIFGRAFPSHGVWVGKPVATSATGAYSDTITAGTVPITGQAVVDVFAITEAITAGVVPITGAAVAPAFGSTDAITAGSVPITGSTVAPTFAITEAITAGTVPITGQSLTDVFAQTEAITAGTVPINGATVTPVFSGGGNNYSDTITAGTVPITGQDVVPVFAISTVGPTGSGGRPVSYSHILPRVQRQIEIERWERKQRKIQEDIRAAEKVRAAPTSPSPEFVANLYARLLGIEQRSEALERQAAAAQDVVRQRQAQADLVRVRAIMEQERRRRDDEEAMMVILLAS